MSLAKPRTFFWVEKGREEAPQWRAAGCLHYFLHSLCVSLYLVNVFSFTSLKGVKIAVHFYSPAAQHLLKWTQKLLRKKRSRHIVGIWHYRWQNWPQLNQKNNSFTFPFFFWPFLLSFQYSTLQNPNLFKILGLVLVSGIGLHSEYLGWQWPLLPGNCHTT